jgi:transcriptional antiterminator RfaH
MSWLVVTTRPQQEYRAVFELKQQGATVFLPECLSSRSKGRTAPRDILAPLFPRYLFCRPEGLAIRSVKGTRGVSGIIQYGDGSPRYLREREMEELMAICGAVVDMRPQAARIYVGQQMTVKSGPFSGMSGVVMELLGNKLRIELATGSESITITTDKSRVSSSFATA